MGLVLRFLRHPLYHEAHPGEAEASEAVCDKCVLAMDVQGEVYLLWGAYGGTHWSLSRHDKRYNTDVRVSDILLEGWRSDEEGIESTA